MHTPHPAGTTLGDVMASHIPFVYSSKDYRFLKSIYADSNLVRLSLDSTLNPTDLPPGIAAWLDSGFDGFERWPNANDNWKKFIKKFTGWESIGDKQFQRSPDAGAVSKFVSELLTNCMERVPTVACLSVPQLPTAGDASRNKINRCLADAAGNWKVNSKFRGKLILPIILTHQEHTNLKTDRNQRVRLAVQCFQASTADGYWVVDSSLSDQTGAGTYANRRLPALIRLHAEIAEKLGTREPVIGGPYWALNLVLWARGLITNPAIGLGVGYQYHVPAGIAMQAKRRIALPPLRRWATVSPQLETWLKNLPKSDPGLQELRDLVPQFSKFYVEDEARNQVARFYKRWFNKLESTRASGRALALYQDFSTAYVLGKPLSDLPAEEGTARRPERIAEQFMLQCL